MYSKGYPFLRSAFGCMKITTTEASLDPQGQGRPTGPRVGLM